jgi:hypothetical protein
MILHRFGAALDRRAWDAHRYESDAAASLAQAVQILEAGSGKVGRAAQAAGDVTSAYVETLGKTVFLRRPGAAFGASARAFAGPLQLTAVPAANPHLSEWRGNGGISVSLHSLAGSPGQAQVTDWAFAVLEDDGFAARVELAFGRTPFAASLVAAEALAAVPPGRDMMLVQQRATALGFGMVDGVSLHTWRFTQEVHNGNRRTLTHAGGGLEVSAGEAVDTVLEGDWVCVDGAISLSLQTGREGGIWRVTQPADRQDDLMGVRWLELSADFDRKGKGRTRRGETLGRCAAVVSLGPEPIGFTAESLDGQTTFSTDDGSRWTLSAKPGLEQLA